MYINNHADNTVLGSNFIPVHYFEISVDLFGWDASSRIVECHTISGDISYDHPISGQVYMFMYHIVINCPKLENHLVCLMQSWMVGVRINEIPKFSEENPD